jgi:SOS response regulatory protein OraA/RecX
MSNIKASLITNIGNPSLLAEYAEYVRTTDQSTRGNLQIKLEKALGEQVFGAKKVARDDRFEQDWFIDDKAAAQEIANNLGMFQIDKDGVLRIEGKLQTKGVSSDSTTGIGTTVLFNKNTLDFSILKEIRRNLGSTNKLRKEEEAIAFEDLILNQLKKQGTTPADRFNYLEKNAPKTIHNPAYNKSKNLVIFSKTAGSLQAYNIFFPRSKFKPPIFGVSITDRTIKYQVQTAFEKSIVKELKSATTTGINKQNEKEQLSLEKSLASKLKVARTKTTSITFGKETKTKASSKENITIIYYTTNSMPVSSAKIRGGRKLTYSPVQGPSLVDITVAVRGRTKLRMRRGSGNPRPPKIYERTGDFRSSIEAVADLRANTIQYFYTPYYERLERYGYEINDLVEGSIRSVAQAQFKRNFNLIRRNT